MLPDTSTTDAAAVYLALGAVIKRIRRLPLPEGPGAALIGTHPAPRHVAALLHVASDAPVGMSELATRLGVSLATASQVVTDLEDWGVVERTSGRADRRRTFVALAPAHRPLATALLDSRLKPMQRALHRLEPAQREAFIHGLHVLAEEFDCTAEMARGAE